MKLAVIYDSKTGNTRQAAEWIAEGMARVADAEARSFSIDAVDAAFVQAAKGVVIGCPSYMASMTPGRSRRADADAGRNGGDGMLRDEIRLALLARQDPEYREFQAKLIPGPAGASMIGVRTPALRALARELARREDIGEFLHALPHEAFDENQLHAFLLSELRDYARCVREVCAFLPFVDNWATCDQLNPKVFAKHRRELSEQIPVWLGASGTYEVRFGIRMLMCHFLDADFDPRCLEAVAALRSEEYYVNMMIAWFFATALAKRYDAAVPYLETRALAPWVHNKTIQKAVESDRIGAETKAYLRTLRLPSGAKGAASATR